MNTDHSKTDHSSQTAPFQGESFALSGTAETDSIVSVVSQPNLGSQRSSEDRLSAASKNAIEFRVTSPGAPNRRLRLTGNRYTFGSAHGCSIQLADQTLRPMHAVLIRDAQRILVRAYSVPIEINSVRTTESPLFVGDTLRLGDYRFELLTGPMIDRAAAAASKSSIFGTAKVNLAAPVIAESATRVASPSATPIATPPPATLIGSIPKLTNKRTASDDAWHEQLRREIEQWRKRQEEVDRRESRCCDRETALQGRETELWSRVETLHKRESELVSEASKARIAQEQYTRKVAEVERLQQASLSREELFAQKEAEFKRLQDHYQGQVEDARRQVVHSQQQAKTAADAIAEMREQFTALKDHLEALTSNKESLRREEEDTRAEQEKVQLELEQARDQAVDAKAESEAKCQEAEARLAEITEQYESICQQIEEERSAANQSGEAAGVLQAQIEELQGIVQRASDESALLKNNYLEARDSVAQLETMLRDTEANHGRDHESWTAEADLLHESVQALSLELANANSELSQLKEANQTLTLELDQFKVDRDDVASERDQAVAERARILDEMSSLPSNEAFLALSEELGQTSDQMNAAKAEYENQIANLRLQLADLSKNQLGNQLGEVEQGGREDDPSQNFVQSPIDQEFIEPVGELTQSEPNVDEIAADQADNSWPSYEATQETPFASADEAASVIGTDDSFEERQEEPHQESQEGLQGESFEASLEQEVAVEKVAAENDDAPTGSQPSIWETHQSSLIDEEPSEPDEMVAADDDAQPRSFASQLIQDIESSIESNDEETDFEEGASSQYPQGMQGTPGTYEEEPEQADAAQDEPYEPYEPTYQSTNLLEQVGSLTQEDQADGQELDVRSMLVSDEPDVNLESPSEAGPTDELADEPANGPTFTSAWSLDEAEAKETPSADSATDDDDNDAAAKNGRYDLASLKEEEYDDHEVGEEANGEPIDQPQMPSQPHTPEETKVGSSVAGKDDDDSIEAYMNRLLKRVQGESSSLSVSQPKSTATSSVSPASVGSSPAEPAAEAAGKEATADSSVAEYDPSEPMIPRSQAPERTGNLSAMRDLANQSARTAISRSVRVQTRDTQLKAMTKLTYAGIAAFCAFLIVAFVASWLKFVAAAAILVLGSVFAHEGQQLFNSARQRLQQAEAGAQAELDEDEEESVAIEEVHIKS